MSIAKHHAEWLSLIEVSGPFLSLPVLVQRSRRGWTLTTRARQGCGRS